jgi:alpha-galactosidase
MSNDIGFGDGEFLNASNQSRVIPAYVRLASWGRILEILNVNSFLLDYTDFWGRNDPDMLEVSISPGTQVCVAPRLTNGIGGQRPLHRARTLALRAVGNHERSAADGHRSHEPHPRANRHPAEQEPARPYKWGINPDYTFNSTYPAMYWSGTSSNGTIVALFNPTVEEMTMSAEYKEIPQLASNASYDVIDVWSGKSLGCVASSVKVDVAGNDTAVFLFGEECT